MVSSSSNPVHQAVDVELKREQQAASQSVSLEAGQSNGDLSIGVLHCGAHCTAHHLPIRLSVLTLCIFCRPGRTDRMWSRRLALLHIRAIVRGKRLRLSVGELVPASQIRLFGHLLAASRDHCLAVATCSGLDVAMVFFVRAAAAASATSTEA